MARRFAGILLVRDDGAMLLAKRSQHVSEPSWWSIPGGHLRRDEDVVDGALREFDEEMGSVPPLQLVSAHPVRIPKGIYTTIIATVSDRAAARWHPQLNWEHDDWGWFYPGALPQPMHPGIELFV